MKDGKYISLPVKYEIQPFDDSRFLRISCRFIHDSINPNRSNFDFDVIKAAEFTVANIPILAYMEDGDFTEHAIETERVIDENGYIKNKVKYLEKPCGVVPEINNNYRYEKFNGKTYAYVDAYLWREYASEECALLEKDGNAKLSMEIKIDNYEYDTKNKIMDIKAFKYLGFTLLGKKYGTGIELAQAEVYATNQRSQEFYKMVDELSQVLKFSLENKGDEKMSKSITIDNSKESSTSGKWSNPGKKLYEPLMEQDNAKTLLDEAYLDVEDGYEDAPSEHLKYPHHVISDDKLIVHKDGVEAAFSRLHAQGIESGKEINHLKKHYKELGLDMDKFIKKEDDGMKFNKIEHASKFGLTADQVYEILRNAVSQVKYNEGNYEYTKYYVETYDDVNVYVYDYVDSCVKGMPYTIEDNVATVKFGEEFKVIRGGYIPVGENETEESNEEMSQYCGMIKTMAEDMMKKMSAADQEPDEDDFKSKYEELNSKYKEMCDKMNALESQYKSSCDMMDEMKTKMSEMSDYSELKQYKVDNEKAKADAEAKEKEKMVENVFAEFSQTLSAEELAPFKEKSKEFDIVSLRKELFAILGEKVAKNNNGSNDGFVKTGLITNISTEIFSSNKKKGVWSTAKSEVEK